MELVGRFRRFADTPSARVAPLAWRRVFDAYRRGDHAAVVAQAGSAFAELSRDPDGRQWVAGPALLAGAVLAAEERYVPATDAMRDGLARLDGTVVADVLGQGHWFRVAFVDLLMLQGSWQDAEAQAHEVLERDPPIEVRLGATRALVHLRVVDGRLESAHQLANAATDLARRTCSRRQLALVEADRAVLAAASGTHDWAVRTANELGPRLVGGRTSPHGVQAAAQAGHVAMVAARASAAAGDSISAAEMAELGQAAAHTTGRHLERVRALVATAAAARVAGAVGAAEAYAGAAVVEATSLGSAPLTAIARAEQAELALHLGHVASAGPQLERARSELIAAGLHLEASRLASAFA